MRQRLSRLPDIPIFGRVTESQFSPQISILRVSLRSFMRVHIFDVEHGECNALETPSGELILIGVGHNSSTNWRPSSWLKQRRQRPSWIILSNLDRDHLSDLP